MAKTLANLAHSAFGAGRRLVAPLAGFPGVEMIGSANKIAKQSLGEPPPAPPATSP